MKLRKLPRADFSVSELSFGTMSLKGSDAENAWLIHKAMAGGINYFDTADLYDAGQNEVTVGKALKGRRDKVILATKVGNALRADGSGWDWNPRKAYILKAVDRSLERLQTDYIDVYQLHGGTLEDPFDEVIEAFEILKSVGKIRQYGISSIRPNVIRHYVGNAQIMSNMMQYSLLDRRPEESALDLLRENGIGVMVRGALAKGLLAGKSITDYLNYKSQEVDLLLDKIKVFSIEKAPLSHLALQWVLAHPAVTSCVVGVRTEAQLNELLSYYDSPPLTQEQVKTLGAVLTPNVYSNHR